MPYKVGQRTVYLVGEKRDEFAVSNLAEGEFQDYTVLKKECKDKGSQFVDKTFDPHTMDIVGRDFRGKYPFGTQVKEWKRPRDASRNIVFSEEDAHRHRYCHSDVTQGYLGDCFYLAALASVADNQKLINFVIPEDNNEDEDLGIYHFRFWKNGYFFDIVVDDQLPYYSRGVLGAQVSGNEIWVLLIEKAYAKLYGSYASISGGSPNDAYEDFTGGMVGGQLFSKGPLSWDTLSPKGNTQVFAGLSTGRGPTSDRRQDPVTGLSYGHAYSVLSREEFTNNVGEQVRLIKVRNPLGKNEWFGAWSDCPEPSAEWDTVSAEDKDRLLFSKNDGEFWITLDDISSHFHAITLCYWLNDLDTAGPDAAKKHQWQELHGEWKCPGTAGLGQDYYDQWANSPQYRVTIQDVEKGPDVRGAALFLALFWKGNYDKNLVLPLNFEVFEVRNRKDKGTGYSADDFLYQDLIPSKDFQEGRRHGGLRSGREVYSGGFLKGGTYVIIPLHETGKEGRFILRVVCEGAGQVVPLPLAPPANAT